MTVMGRYFMNWPMMPGMKMMGKKATTVVMVEEMIGPATSLEPSIAACCRDLPMEAWRKMFSTMTMPLSTSMPRARIRLNSTIMFRVTPSSCSTKKDRSMEKGMARDTKKELRRPRKSRVTPRTSRKPENMLFSRSLTMSLISLEPS
jgi:hypothetical protein